MVTTVDATEPPTPLCGQPDHAGNVPHVQPVRPQTNQPNPPAAGQPGADRAPAPSRGKRNRVTAIKLDGKPSTHAAEALAPHAGAMFAKLGSTRMAVVELRSVERAEPAADEDKEQSVKVRVAHLEIANADQEDSLRRAMQALNLHRTSYGTLDDDGYIELSASTLERTAGEVNAIEAARLHVAVQKWTEFGRRILGQAKITMPELRREFDNMVRGLQAAADGKPND